MNKFRKLGPIGFNGKIEVDNSLLRAVLHDKPEINGMSQYAEIRSRSARRVAIRPNTAGGARQKRHEGVANGVRCWHFSDCVDAPAMRLPGGKRTWRGHRVSAAISDKTGLRGQIRRP